MVQETKSPIVIWERGGSSIARGVFETCGAWPAYRFVVSGVPGKNRGTTAFARSSSAEERRAGRNRTSGKRATCDWRENSFAQHCERPAIGKNQRCAGCVSFSRSTARSLRRNDHSRRF